MLKHRFHLGVKLPPKLTIAGFLPDLGYILGRQSGLFMWYGWFDEFTLNCRFHRESIDDRDWNVSGMWWFLGKQWQRRCTVCSFSVRNFFNGKRHKKSGRKKLWLFFPMVSQSRDSWKWEPVTSIKKDSVNVQFELFGPWLGIRFEVLNILLFYLLPFCRSCVYRYLSMARRELKLLVILPIFKVSPRSVLILPYLRTTKLCNSPSKYN